MDCECDFSSVAEEPVHVLPVQAGRHAEREGAVPPPDGSRGGRLRLRPVRQGLPLPPPPQPPRARRARRVSGQRTVE